MRKFLITVAVLVNDKKIAAIKDLRSATGMGLLAAKTFVETPYGDANFPPFGYGGKLIVSGDQAARLFSLALTPYVTGQPRIMIDAIEEIVDGALDISNLLM